MFLIYQVDLVAQGDSVYDIIDASDHLITRTNLSPSTSLDAGEEKKKILQATHYIFSLRFHDLSFHSLSPQTASFVAVSTLPSLCGGRVLGTSWF